MKALVWKNGRGQWQWSVVTRNWTEKVMFGGGGLEPSRRRAVRAARRKMGSVRRADREVLVVGRDEALEVLG